MALLFVGVLACACLAQDDALYTSLIRFYTTDPRFTTPLGDHLPASATVPSPLKFFGHIVGEPNLAHGPDEIYAYMRELARTSKRVRIEKIGESEEGRDILLVLISSEKNLSRLKQYKKINALLSDPRKLLDYKGDGNMAGADERAHALMPQTVPFYYFTAGIHPWEIAPSQTSIEFAYRLAVDEAPELRSVRDSLVVMITPVLDPDGLYRVVARQDPAKAALIKPHSPFDVYHENNRDNLVLGLPLSKALSHAWFEYHPLVQNDQHQAVAHLFISPGTGPDNPWIDQSTTPEALDMAKDSVEKLSAWGVPGVYTRGLYDGYSPTFSTDLANYHNAIGRAFEVDGLGTRTGMLDHRFELFTRPNTNPPLKVALWSFRDSINLNLSAMLLGIQYAADHRDQMLRSFYNRGRSSVLRPWHGGPAALIIPAQGRNLLLAHLLDLMDRQKIEVKQLLADATTRDGKFKAGSYVIRLDQPYGRLATMLFARQNLAQDREVLYESHVGWSLDLLNNCQVVSCSDASILAAPMAAPRDDNSIPQRPEAGYMVLPPAHDAFSGVISWRYGIRIKVAEQPFEIAGRLFDAGSMIVPAAVAKQKKLQPLLQANRGSCAICPTLPEVASHELECPRIGVIRGVMDGWVSIVFREMGLKPAYVSANDLQDENLKNRYDVIVAIEIDPNTFVSDNHEIAESDRLAAANRSRGLSKFLSEGGVLMAFHATSFALNRSGVVPKLGVMDLSATQSILLVRRSNSTSPVLYGYSSEVPVMHVSSLTFDVGKRLDPRWRVLLKYADMDHVMLSGGWVDGREPRVKKMDPLGNRIYEEIGNTGALMQCAVGKGTVLMFSFDPFFRDLPVGTWLLLSNALGNWSHLNVSEKAA